jgi:hypothetical protein
VTKHCHDFEKESWSTSDSVAECDSIEREARAKSTVYHDDDTAKKDDSNTARALWRGCEVAFGLRSAVFNKLGFTLSAGISINKSVAKLGAGFGKPNGQAIILPSSIPAVSDEDLLNTAPLCVWSGGFHSIAHSFFSPQLLEETLIRKARNLGGKIGKKVNTFLFEAMCVTLAL